jgi:predicted Zn-dependent peptidase
MLNRKFAPPFQKTLSLSLPRPVEVTLSSGVKIFLVQGIQQNVAKIEVVFGAGKWFEPKTGLSHFTATLLEKGTRTKTAEEIANTLDYYGASLEIHAGFDFVSVSLYALMTQWSNVFPVFLEIITDPSFPEKEWNLTKDIFLQNLKVNNEKTSYRASALIRARVFGEGHPYGSSVEEEHVHSITPSDFHDFFKTAFNVHSIYGVGNFTMAEIESMKQGFQSLPARAASSSRHVHPPDAAPAQYVKKVGSLQSSIRLGKRSPLKKDPDYFDLQIFNHLLGGFFGSRLMKNIREEKGLTYGIHSSLNTFVRDGFFVIGADVNKVNLEFAITEIRRELRNLRDHAVDGQELELAKNHFIGSLQADMANLFSVIEKIKNIQLHHLPQRYYQDLFNRVDRVGPEDILRIAAKYFQDDTLFEVAVG